MDHLRSLITAMALILVGCNAQPAIIKPVTVTPNVCEVPFLDLTNADGKPSVVTCEIRNFNERSIQIVGIETSCLCTVAEPLATTMLSPAASVSLSLKVNRPTAGKKESVVRVRTDPPEAEASVRVVAHGPPQKVPEFVRFPSELAFIAHSPGASTTVTYLLKTIENAAEPPWIAGASIDDELFHVTCELDLEASSAQDALAHRVYRCVVTGSMASDTDMRPRVVEYQLTAQNDPPRDDGANDGPQHRTLIRPQIVPRYRLVPDELILDVGVADDPAAARRVFVIAADDSPSLHPAVELGSVPEGVQVSMDESARPTHSAIASFLVGATRPLESRVPVQFRVRDRDSETELALRLHTAVASPPAVPE